MLAVAVAVAVTVTVAVAVAVAAAEPVPRGCETAPRTGFLGDVVELDGAHLGRMVQARRAGGVARGEHGLPERVQRLRLDETCAHAARQVDGGLAHGHRLGDGARGEQRGREGAAGLRLRVGVAEPGGRVDRGTQLQDPGPAASQRARSRPTCTRARVASPASPRETALASASRWSASARSSAPSASDRIAALLDTIATFRASPTRRDSVSARS